MLCALGGKEEGGGVGGVGAALYSYSECFLKVAPGFFWFGCCSLQEVGEKEELQGQSHQFLGTTWAYSNSKLAMDQ